MTHPHKQTVLFSSRNSRRGNNQSTETPRLARTVRELRRRHSQQPSTTSHSDDIAEESPLASTTNNEDESFDIAVNNSTSILKEMESNNGELPASLSVFPRTPITVQRPTYNNNNNNNNIITDITSPLINRHKVHTLPLNSHNKEDKEDKEKEKEKEKDIMVDTIEPSIDDSTYYAFPRTPVIQSKMTSNSVILPNRPESTMITPMNKQTSLYASQLVPVSGKGYIASDEGTPPSPIEESKIDKLTTSEQQHQPVLNITTPCVKRTHIINTTDLLNTDTIQSTHLSLSIDEDQVNRLDSLETKDPTTSNSIHHSYRPEIEDRDNARVLVTDTPPSPVGLSRQVSTYIDDPITCITDTPSELLAFNTTVNNERDNGYNVNRDESVTQPTQLIGSIILPLNDHHLVLLPSVEQEASPIDPTTMPTLVLSRTPSPDVTGYRSDHYALLEENGKHEEIGVLEPTIELERDEQDKKSLLEAISMEHPSFQFHTPIQDESTISHVSVKRRIPSKDETLTFSAFANRHNDRQNDMSESLEMNYSDSDLPSHLTITDSVQDRFIRSDPVIETPQTNYKKRTKDILPIDLIGSSTSNQLKRKRQRVVIQRDIGFDQASESRSSADQDLPLSIEENQSHLTNSSYRQHSRHSRRHSNGSGAINTTPLRLCEHCDTSVTTGWRKGPTGRPTLCNRCGSFYAIHNKLPIPKSDTALNVSRSSLLDPPEYLPGDRVWAYSSYDGYYHSATIKGSEEREHIYRVLFDDRRHNGDSNGGGQKNKSKVTLDTSHLRPLTLMVNTQVWIMRMGQRTLKQARIQAVDFDEERCRVQWLTEDGREESTTASISPWISISRIALPVTSLLDDIDMIEADMASNNNHETPKEKLLVEEDVEEDVEEEEVKKVTEKKEKNTVLDVTAPEFINSLLGPSLNLVDNEQDSPMLSNQLLFKDMVFVLTNIPSKSDNDGKKEDSIITCTKEQLTQMIEEHGGRISSNLFGSHSINEHGSSIVTSTILLCGEVKRTKKHLLALAMNIPRVSYKWINDAIHTGQTDTMLNYLLCNGFSIELNAYVASRPAISLLSNDGDSERNNRLLAGLIIHLKGGISFKNDWEAVLKAAGAIIADRKQLTSVGCDYIVVEKRPTPSWLNSLSTMTRGKMKAVVTSEWVAQCLINQRIVHWQGHPSYTKWS